MKDLIAVKALSNLRKTARVEREDTDLSDKLDAYLTLNLEDTVDDDEKRCVLKAMGGSSNSHLMSAMNYLSSNGCFRGGAKVRAVFRAKLREKSPVVVIEKPPVERTP